MGEAKNPGPNQWQRTTPWSHTPGWRHAQVKAQTKWCGTWGVPQVLAGEFAKGIYPGPKPSSAVVGPDPHRNTGCTWNSVNMIPLYMSRAETVQHNPQPWNNGEQGWYGWGGPMYNQGNPYQHPVGRPPVWPNQQGGGKHGKKIPRVPDKSRPARMDWCKHRQCGNRAPCQREGGTPGRKRTREFGGREGEGNRGERRGRGEGVAPHAPGESHPVLGS